MIARRILSLVSLFIFALLTPLELWATSFDLGVSQPLFKKENASSYLELALNHSLPIHSYTLAFEVAGASDLTHKIDSDFSYAFAAISKKYNQTNLSLTLGLPASKDSRENQSLQFTIKPGVTFSGELAWASWFIIFNVARNFHQHTTSKDGRTNNEYSSSQSLLLVKELNDIWTAELSLNHLNTWTYTNNSREYLSHSQRVKYTINKNLFAYFGHNYGNPYVNAYKADGETLNLSLSDERYSMAYTQLTYNF